MGGGGPAWSGIGAFDKLATMVLRDGKRDSGTIDHYFFLFYLTCKESNKNQKTENCNISIVFFFDMKLTIKLKIWI